MKTKRILCLLPFVVLAGCKGVDFTIDFERADEYAKHIIAQQDKESFKLTNKFYFETESFRMTGSTKKKTDYTYNSILYDKTKNYLYILTKSKIKTEGEQASVDKVSERYIYVSEDHLYDVFNGGEEKTYKVFEESFEAYISKSFTFEFDYKRQDKLDIDALKNSVDENNKTEGVKTDIELMSGRNVDLKIELETSYKDILLDGETNKIKEGKLKEFYQWEECYFVNHKVTKSYTYENNSQLMENYSTSLVFDMTTKEMKEKAVINYPDISEYTNITPDPEIEEGNE